MDRLVAPRALVGQRLDDRYHLLRVLSEDAEAEVYEADDERLQRRVAVHVFDGDAPTHLTSRSIADERDVLDAGQHDGRGYLVLPFVEGAVGAATGPGDDEPTGELPTATDPTKVLPLPLVPAADPTPAGPEPSRAPAAVRSFAAGFWARRALLVALAGIVLAVVLVGLAMSDGGEVPTESSVPVTVETTSTVASTTTSAPTTERPAGEGRGKGKGKKGDG